MDPRPETRRNFTLGVLNGLFFVLGETLIDPTLVIAAFVNRLTGSALWVGFAAAMLDYSWFLPQLWVSGYLQTQPYKMPLYRFTAVVRACAWVALTASIFAIAHEGWLFGAFIIMLGVAALGSGLSGLSFLEIVSKTIPPHLRGQFFAWRLAIAGLMGVGASAVVQWILGRSSPLAFPDNFGLLFALATSLFFCGWWAFASVREPADKAVAQRASFSRQLRRALGFLCTDLNFRRFLYLRSALMAAGAVVPFFAIYVQTELGGSLGMIGVYLIAFKVANLAANIYLGQVSAGWGYHRLMQVATWSGLAMTLLVLALVGAAAVTPLPGWAAAWWLVPVFVVNGIREAGAGIAGQSLLLEIAPEAERSLYLGFTNTFLGVVVLAASLSGLVIETWGFVPLLALTLAAYLLSIKTAIQLQGIIHTAQTPADN